MAGAARRPGGGHIPCGQPPGRPRVGRRKPDWPALPVRPSQSGQHRPGFHRRAGPPQHPEPPHRVGSAGQEDMSQPASSDPPGTLSAHDWSVPAHPQHRSPAHRWLTGPKDQSGPCPFRRSWSPCSATITAATAPHPMAACSAGSAAASSAKAATAAPGTAHTLALGPTAATQLARRPYDLRHAALSLWLNSGTAPAEIARRAGHSVHTLLAVYTHCIDGQEDITNRQIERALHARGQAHHHKASGPPNRRHHPNPVRYMSVTGPQTHGWGGHPPPVLGRRPELSATTTAHRFRSSETIQAPASSIAGTRPGYLDLAHVWPTAASKRSTEPLLLSARAVDASPRQRL